MIKIGIDDPLSSEILLPAKTREILDWEIINKLTLNLDFKEFLRRIKNDLASKEIRKEEYDNIFEPEELVKIINRERER